MTSTAHPDGNLAQDSARPQDLRDWLSVHVPVFGGIYDGVCDDLLRTVIGPAIEIGRREGWATLAFFVRYVDTRPHVRLRLRCQSARARAHLVAMLADLWSTTARSHGHPALGTELEWKEYTPEVARYGGLRALPISETVFDASSTFALTQLSSAVSGHRADRLGRGILAMLVLAHSFSLDDQGIVAFIRQYAANYLKVVAPTNDLVGHAAEVFERSRKHQAASLEPFVEATRTRLRDGAPLTAALDDYRTALKRARHDFQRLAVKGGLELHGASARDWDTIGPFLASSFVHMTSNRLGISIIEESFLASMLHESLEAPLVD